MLLSTTVNPVRLCSLPGLQQATAAPAQLLAAPLQCLCVAALLVMAVNSQWHCRRGSRTFVFNTWIGVETGRILWGGVIFKDRWGDCHRSWVMTDPVHYHVIRGSWRRGVYLFTYDYAIYQAGADTSHQDCGGFQRLDNCQSGDCNMSCSESGSDDMPLGAQVTIKPKIVFFYIWTISYKGDLASRTLVLESKRFYLDVKENQRGRFIKIAEISADGRKVICSFQI